MSKKVTGPVFKIEDDLYGMTKKQIAEEVRIMRERAERVRQRLDQNVSFVLKKKDDMTK
ncbi:MAG: hypothetical protein HYY52_08645 [Candidatus Melainabacteria bacterium]|nr:hypothetical protein [Candidatus Melainabacteria bacterium]